jgi:hypothetical protein
MKPGDLVTLKDRTHYSGVDVTGSRFIDVPHGAIGVYMGFELYRVDTIYDLILTGGKLVKCARGVWSVLDETR